MLREVCVYFVAKMGKMDSNLTRQLRNANGYESIFSKMNEAASSFGLWNCGKHFPQRQ